MVKVTKYQKGILPNLLSGFYEQVELEKKDESHRVIFQELRKEFWLQQKQGAIVELGYVLELIDKHDKDFGHILLLNNLKEPIENRLKELGK